MNAGHRIVALLRVQRAVAAVALSMGSVILAVGSADPAGAAQKPQPAGPHPSQIAKMVCQSDSQHEIADALGLKATVKGDTWVDHRYSCNYVYSKGKFTLSVKELSSWAQTYAYFALLGRQMGDVGKLANLGQGAFQTTNGSVVVRKDWKVLLVNVADLPARFGVPATASKFIAVTVADVILGCWAGD